MSQANPTLVEATKYAENYILYGDQTKAFRVAFPMSKTKPEHAHTKASLMHKTTQVQQRIKELQSGLKKQTEEEFNLSVSKIKQMLTTAAAKGLKNKTDAQGNQVPISISGAVSAISEINKMDGNHAATKTDHTSSDGSMTPKAGIDASSLSIETLKEIMAAKDATK